MMEYLSVKDVLYINEEVVKVSGGSIGVRDLGLIDSAVNRPQSSFGGEDLYGTMAQKAAALFHLLVFNHAFLDGNKRTAITATELLLNLNGYTISASQKEKENFTMKIVEQHLDVDQIAEWLESNSGQEEK